MYGARRSFGLKNSGEIVQERAWSCPRGQEAKTAAIIGLAHGKARQRERLARPVFNGTDWTRVKSGTYHNFHVLWMCNRKDAKVQRSSLNLGVFA